MVKTLKHSDGRTFRLGRNRPTVAPKFRLRDYPGKILPTPPAEVDYRPKASAALSRIYGNDVLGDCVIACMAHAVGVLTGNAGNIFLFKPPQITALYCAIGGYVSGDPSTDNGCDEITAWNYWQWHGAPKGQNKIAGWLEVNAADPSEVRQALWLFETLLFGIELPDAWIDPQPPASSGFTWDVAGPPDPQNGHCVLGCAYTSAGVIVDTWGMTGLITNAAMEKYAVPSAGGNLYTAISQEGIVKASQKAPNGYNWEQLEADFTAMESLAP